MRRGLFSCIAAGIDVWYNKVKGCDDVIAELAELNAYLADAQTRRAAYVRCEIASSLSERMNDTALTEAILLGLSMAQGVQQRILRSRGRGAVLTAKIRYRQGVWLLDGTALTAQETAVLKMAHSIVADFISLDETARFHAVYGWICTHVRYIHTAPGRKGYERLVCASGALQDGQANCQGFADALYLLCGLAGIACEYRIGRGEKRLHVWNAVCLNGVWQEVDVSKGARSAKD